MQHRLRHHQLEDKDHAVDQYDGPGAEGRILGRNRVAYRKNGQLPLFLQIMESWKIGMMRLKTNIPMFQYSNLHAAEALFLEPLSSSRFVSLRILTLNFSPPLARS